MYHPDIVDRRLFVVQKDLPFKLHRYEVDESIALTNMLEALWDKDKQRPVRLLSDAEKEFILNETHICTHDFNYFAPRYAMLSDKNRETVHLKFWESQRIALEHIAVGEERAWKHRDSNLWCWLKARQLGATQVCETMITHRMVFYENQNAVIASDKPENSVELSRRVKFIYNHLPWWMTPNKDSAFGGSDVKGQEIAFGKLNNILRIGHGRLKGGGLGQGSTINIFHLTEIPDWENWQQIDEDFLPTVPRLPTAVGFMESTARGRDDHWHTMFQQAWDKKSARWNALFIPWYSETETYRMLPPDDWQPSPLTVAHAEKVIRQSPLYCMGRTVRLSKEQMYWYERTYNEYKDTGRLHIFFQEYASDHMEAFQNVSSALFDADLLNRLRANAVPPQRFTLRAR